MLEVRQMNEQIFFVIDGKELVLDKVLVEFNEAPIFFVCKNEEKFFISLCVDMEQERYLVAAVKLGNLSKMLHGKITMRDLILRANLFWDITVGEDVSKDIIIEKNVETISLDELPYEGEYLTLATKDLERYVEKIDATLYEEGNWEERMLPIYDEHFETSTNITYKIAVQNIYESIYESIIKNLQQIYFNRVGEESIFNKEVGNGQMYVDTEDTRVKVKISENDRRSWAA